MQNEMLNDLQRFNSSFSNELKSHRFLVKTRSPRNHEKVERLKPRMERGVEKSHSRTPNQTQAFIHKYIHLCNSLYTYIWIKVQCFKLFQISSSLRSLPGQGWQCSQAVLNLAMCSSGYIKKHSKLIKAPSFFESLGSLLVNIPVCLFDKPGSWLVKIPLCSWCNSQTHDVILERHFLRYMVL